MRRVLLTGAGGFIGAHVLEHLLEETVDTQIVCTDSFRHKGKTSRIADVLETNTGVCGPAERHARTEIVTHDLRAPFDSQTARRIGEVDYILALASESHVDRSIDEPDTFVRNNTELAINTLEFARGQSGLRQLVWMSTDEVYGPVAGNYGHPEWAPIVPSNPYSASKACQEAIAISYWRTYGLPLSIVNCMNLIGERQDTEKYLPMLISKINNYEEVTVHGVEGNIGTRHYLHARNLADSLTFLLSREPKIWDNAETWADGMPVPDRYNVVGPDRISNLELAQMVADIIGNPLHYKLVDFHSTRPGHDAHYGLDPKKLTGLGWLPPIPFEESLERTVRWTLAHPEWMV